MTNSPVAGETVNGTDVGADEAESAGSVSPAGVWDGLGLAVGGGKSPVGDGTPLKASGLSDEGISWTTMSQPINANTAIRPAFLRDLRVAIPSRCLLVSGALGQLDCERGASSDLALDFYSPAVSLHKLTRDGQT